MLTLGIGHIVGVIFVLVIITLTGVYAGSKVKTATDFSVGGRKANTAIIAGTILGTLIGGSSTIGTAQFAFQYGLCAWWFTLGAGIAFFVLGLFTKKLYVGGSETVSQYLANTYGNSIGVISSIFSSIGIFLTIIAQGLSMVVLLTSMFGLTPLMASVIGILLVMGYVFFGGVWGTGLVGIVKLFFIYIIMVACGMYAYNLIGGYEGALEKFTNHPWFSLFGRGFSLDIASGFSLLVGVLSTQTYFQAIYSGKNWVTSRKGALISAIMIPPIGLCGIAIGLYMKAHFPNTPSGQVLPIFIMKHLPPLFGGIALATLLVGVVGTWAGLVLGISTMLTKDIYKKFFRKIASDKEELFIQRFLIFVICICGMSFSVSHLKSLIIGWSFLSMGLRGCTILFPLIGAMFFPRLVSPLAGTLSALCGPLVNITWQILYPKGVDPLYPGLATSLITLILFSIFQKNRKKCKNKCI